MKSGKIFLLTGEIESGKTSFCLEVARNAQAVDIDLAGLISPAVFKEGVKVAIDVLDLSSWTTRNLAKLRSRETSPVSTRKWSFSPETIEWGNGILREAVPCELLIIDELGPLEIERGEGWVKGLDAVDSGAFQAALVVVRPSLLIPVKQRWDLSGVINMADCGSNPQAVSRILKDFNLTRSS